VTNIHVHNPDDVNAVRLSEQLQAFGCVQHVSTHNAGHMLDFVITRSDISISALRVGDTLSDHAIFRFILQAKTEHCDTHWVTRRAWRGLSIASDLTESLLCSELEALKDKSDDELAELYSIELTRLLDKHCPVVRVRHKANTANRVSIRPAWWSSDVV